MNKILILSLLAILPVSIIILDNLIYLLGKNTWKLISRFFPKMDYELWIVMWHGNEQNLYYMTGLLVSYIVIMIISWSI